MSSLPIKILTTPGKGGHIRYLYHLSDIHIRNQTRHQEYRTVFERLYSSLQEEPKGLIIITGDIVHSKSQISPQLIIETRDFLTNLSKIMPTLFIAGNHDLNLANKQLPDTLSSILHKMNVPNLYYLKESGLYHWGQNICFAVMSVFDYPLIKASNIPGTDRKKIGLLHATLDKSKISLVGGRTHELESEKYKANQLNNYDAVLLGDIHLHQYLDTSKRIAYAGSLIQQNFGERLGGHGYLKWDLDSNNRKNEIVSGLVEIPNDFGYLNLNLVNNNIDTNLQFIQNQIKLPTYLRVKIQIKDSLGRLETAKKIITSLRKNHTLEETIIIPFTPHLINEKASLGEGFESESEEDDKGDTNLETIKMEWQKLDGQQKFLTDYLQNTINLEDKNTSQKTTNKLQLEKNKKILIDRLIDLHSKFHRKNDTCIDYHMYNWNLVSMEFENCFSYAGNNFIDFSKFRGIIGIFGPNFSGKSNLLDILLFGLFDKCSRGDRNDILTQGQNNMLIKITFKIGDHLYQISRSGTKNKTGKNYTVKIDVRFKRSDFDLTGENRHKTNQKIQEYIGSYSDFLLTSLKLQNGGNGGSDLISLKNSERKERLVQLLRLELWDSFHQTANQELRDCKKMITLYEKEIANINSKDLEKKINQIEEEIDRYNSDKKRVSEKFTKYYYQISELKKCYEVVDLELVRLGKNYGYFDIDPDHHQSIEPPPEVSIDDLEEINTHIQQIQGNITTLQSQRKATRFSDLQPKIDELKQKINYIKQELKELGELPEEEHEEGRQMLEGYNDLVLEVRGYKQKIKEIESKSQKLLKLEYDPKCKFCINNVFVIDAKQCQQKYEEFTQKYQLMNEKLTVLEQIKAFFEKADKLKVLEERMQEYLDDFDNHKFNEDIIHKNDILQKDLILAQKKYNHIKKAIRLWNTWLHCQKHLDNKRLDHQIAKLEEKVNKYDQMKNQISEELIHLTSQVKFMTEQKKKWDTAVQELNAYQKQKELLEVYGQAVGKDGIPKFILEKSLPDFERIVNLILENMVDFRIEMEVGDKKWNIYVIYPHKKLNVDLCSGYEKFMVGLATKIGLFHLSQMSKPRFMIIDEGFGNFDRDNLDKLSRVYQFLRNKYKFVLLISHIDQMRFEVNQTLNITLNQDNKIGRVSHVDNREKESKAGEILKFDFIYDKSDHTESPQPITKTNNNTNKSKPKITLKKENPDTKIKNTLSLTLK